ncbi:MAG: SusC/RagA family TonB-linked outer membrane protein, partial [Muribaculaceae bacterium]|nr:SusC/RagA family TonB-linked outer membrane protein [Muribaculaceae bacterium]
MAAVMMLLFTCVPLTLAQDSGPLVKGVVSDENGEPIIGAVVNVPGTSRGTTTDIDGAYTIHASKGETLEFSFIGYDKQQIKVKESPSVVNVSLIPNAQMMMDEVVVIGYGTTTKTDLTGSVTNVKMSDIRDTPVLSVDQALQGRIAGADIMSTTGEPGANTSIRIRGTRSISASNEPLIVVDGVMDAVHDLNDLNMADIQSISVLKDASSTAIYGSRGSNGVIIVTTKQGSGSSGKPNITLKADVGFSQLPKGLDIMNAAEFAQYRNDYAYFNTADGNDAVGEGTPLSKYPYPDPFSLGKGTDWVEEITRTAPTQNYVLSISGSAAKTKYYGSFSYNDTRGIIENSGMKRLTGRISLEHEFAKWITVGYKGTYTHRNQDMNLAAIGGTAYYQAAIYLSPLIKANDNFNPLWNNGQKINTPRSTIDLNTYNMKRRSMNHAITFDITILPNLKFRSQNSYYTYDRETFRYYPSTLPRKVEGEGGEAYRADWKEHTLSSENTLTYFLKAKSGHNLDVMGGFTGYTYHSDSFTLEGKGYMDDNVKWNNMNAVPDKETYSATT